MRVCECECVHVYFRHTFIVEMINFGYSTVHILDNKF